MKSQNLLILELNCHDCVEIKIEFENVLYDSPGKLGIITAFNNESAERLLELLGIKDAFTPVLITPDGVIKNPDEIKRTLSDLLCK